MAKKKTPRWIQELRTEDSVEESDGTFSGNSTAEEIATEVKRKSPDFQAAIGKVQLYLNRAGNRLSESRKKEIKRAQKVLRALYHRPDREKANKKNAGIKTALYHVVWEDDKGKNHMGDAYTEAIGSDNNLFLKQHPEISRKELDAYFDFLVSWNSSKQQFLNSNSEESKKRVLKQLKRDMVDAYESGENFPIFDISEHKPAIVPKIACIRISSQDELFFSSKDKALQFLADISEKTIKIKQ